MNTKLTLTIDDVIIERAKIYAKKKGRSLSDLIENYLKSVIWEQKTTGPEISPIIKSLKGSFKAPEGFDYKKELGESLSKKYFK